MFGWAVCKLWGLPELVRYFTLTCLVAPTRSTIDAVWGVGDDVRDDVGGAQQAGMQGILVQTGKYRPGDEHQWGVSPDATVANFAAAVDWILARRV